MNDKAPSSDVLQTHLVVEHNGNNFRFRIPSLREEAKIGILCRDLRRSLVPTGDGSEDGLDVSTIWYCRVIVDFEVLLEAASVKWPFSAGPGGGPIVDSTKWPEEFTEDAIAVGMKFRQLLADFRSNRALAQRSPKSEAMAGQPNP